MTDPRSLHWRNTPVPDTEEWAARCLAHLLELDGALDPVEAKQMADDMSTRTHWRSMQPEAAAAWLFRPIEPRNSW